MEQPESYIDRYGDKYWYLPSKGKDYHHRLDGPAIELASGTKAWYLNNWLHRLDGPAIVRVDGSKEWWINNRIHRIDGPAVERADGRKIWCINGKRLPKKEAEAWLEENNIDLKTEAGQMAFKLRWT